MYLGQAIKLNWGKKKKKVRIVLIFIAIILMFFLTNEVSAAEETTKLLYQDITINKDGSITVKEAAWLERRI